ncbi:MULTISPECIES: chemotaxis protein CheW [Ramlibacter]|uniref:Chemotaxis protein CheW n=1 Tax=Ramlibacter aquaticus TaxID=2780094 RepID=A0ABR9SAA8_9BURK|nr:MULTISPECIES: chemotaxis protein CheW [Ramlibacter]MBE7939282.1 chemotaxis protein CheW [Ramlibacter aquaticus]
MDMTKEGAIIARQDASRSAAAAVNAAARAGEYLTYRLGNEEYGVDIQRVQEIRSYEAPTRIPGAPSFVKGVVNLRGVIVPIVDLRLRLGAATAEYDRFTVVIVLAVRQRVVGVVVDSVSDVLDLEASAIKPPPELSGDEGSEFITGIGSVGERMLMLVDMETLLGSALGTVPEVQ